MNIDRRTLVAAGALGLVGASSVAESASSARSSPANDAQTYERQLRQSVARGQVTNCMNRYTVSESFGRETNVVQSFAVSMTDVQADVAYGLFYGAEGIKRFAKVSGSFLGKPEQNIFTNGALHLYGNTSEIIEVAEDLKTAKGLWLTFSAVTLGDAAQGFLPRLGYSRRAADFILEDGQWKIWHYVTYGLISMPVGKSWVDPAVVAENVEKRYDWIPENLKPDAPPAVGVGPAGTWRPDRPLTPVGVPVPYRTFAETFSYARSA